MNAAEIVEILKTRREESVRDTHSVNMKG